MDVQSIGESAGVIWRLLEGEHRKWDYNEIKKATGLPDRQINAAIGWLAFSMCRARGLPSAPTRP